MASEFHKGLMAAEMQDDLPCPACDERSLRYAGYDFKTLFFLCSGCDAQYTRDRDTLHKMILYLDQWAISLMHKGVDGRLDLEEWRMTLKQLSSLARNQAIVCPFSTYHEVDSQLDSRLADDLDRLFRHLAQGLAFQHHHTIEVNQLVRALRSYKSESASPDPRWSSRDAFRGDPHEPGQDIDIHIRLRLTKEEIEQTRTKRDKGLAEWTAICAVTEPKDIRDMEALAREQNRAFGQQLFETYLEFICRRERMGSNAEPFDIDYLTRTAKSQEFNLAQITFDSFTRDGLNTESAFRRTQDFLVSDSFAEMPSIEIAGLLLAAVKRKTLSGRKPTKTDAADINMIRHHAPYCDAMLVDNDFRALATEAPINIDQRFNCRLFSSRTRSDFQSWLDECEQVAVQAMKSRDPRSPIPDERVGAKLFEKFGKATGPETDDGSERAE